METNILISTKNLRLINLFISLSLKVLFLFLCLAACDLIFPFSAVAQRHISHSRLLEYAGENGKTESVITPADWNNRRDQILEGMQMAMGTLPDRQNLTELDVKILNETKGSGFIRQSITFAGEPGDRIPALLYIPKELPKDGNNNTQVPSHFLIRDSDSIWSRIHKAVIRRRNGCDKRRSGIHVNIHPHGGAFIVGQVLKMDFKFICALVEVQVY